MRDETQSSLRPRFILHPSSFILFAAVCLYAVTLGGTYIYDDIGRLHKDDRVADVSQWGRFFTESYNDGADNLYRPITSLSYAVQAVTTGTDESGAWAFHAVNIALYGLICFQVTLLGQRLCSDGVGLVAGLLFAVHPVHVEAVANIIGRAELICAMGFVGALLVVAHPTRMLTPARCAMIVGLTLLSIGAKEQGLVLPVVLVAWFGLRRWCRLPTNLDGNGRLLIAMLTLPLAAYLSYRESILPMAWSRTFLDPTIQTMRDAEGLDRLLMPLAVLGRSLQLLVMPWKLAVDYGADVIVPPQRWNDPYLWLGFATLVGWFIAFAISAQKRWFVGLILLIALALSYLPASNGPTIIGTIFGERLLFLPSVFFVLFVVAVVANRRVNPRWATAAVIVVVAVGSVRTFTYAIRWNDRLSFYAYLSEVQPQSVRIWMLLAEEARQRGDLELAANASARATELAPNYWDHWIQRARIARDAGDLDTAIEYAERAAAVRTFGPTAGLLSELLTEKAKQAPTTQRASD